MRPETLIAAAAALAHEHRLAAYRILVGRGTGGLSAGAIARRLEIPPSSLTAHLQQLRRAGLVTRRRRGRQLIYTANLTTMTAVIAGLQTFCARRSSVT